MTKDERKLIKACGMCLTKEGKPAYKPIKHDEALGVIIHTYDKR